MTSLLGGYDMHGACTMSPCSRNYKCKIKGPKKNSVVSVLTKSRTSNSAFTTIEGEITTLLARLLVLAVGLWGALRVVGAREALFQRDILRQAEGALA